MVAIDDVALGMHDNGIASLHFSVALMGGKLPRRQRVVVTPRLVSDTDSVLLPSVVVFGRGAYYRAVRSGVNDNSENMHYRDRDILTAREYTKLTPFEPWMGTAKVQFTVERLNGCDENLAHDRHRAVPTGLTPLPAQQDRPYDTAQQDRPYDTSQRNAFSATATPRHYYQSTAYIDFPLNSTVIDPNYRDNTRRLEEIRSTIDSVLNADRSLLRYIHLKGYASPEGTYSNNERLARERTNSLRRYIIDNFDIPGRFISADYEPENWEGLRDYVKTSQLPERQALLDIIDSNLDPDPKLARIAERFPQTYRFLLENVFPKLRRTDYLIEKARPETDSSNPGAGGATPVGAAAVQLATQGAGETASIARPSRNFATTPMPDVTYNNFRTYRPLFALKTNLLFDAIACPNVELEVAMGKKKRWSLMGEWWFPWWRFDGNSAGKLNQHYRSDQRPTRRAFQMLMGGLEFRYWMLPRCSGGRPWLTGTFVGLYAAGGKYDQEWKSKGRQGEYVSAGISIGHSWALSRHWNLELSAAAGYIYTPFRYYEAEFDDARLIYRYSDKKHYFAPTKLKLSLVWILGGKSKKGGEL